MKKATLIFVFMTSLISAYAQMTDEQLDTLDERLDSLETLAKTHPHIELSGTYISKVAYNGRTEGVNQYGISPEVKAHFGKGWAINYEGDIWSAQVPRYGFTSLGASKDFNIGKAFEGTFGYSHWFFHTSDATQKSGFSNVLDLDTHWVIGDFTIGNTASVLLGKDRALFLEPTINYEYAQRFGTDHLAKWSITPSVTADFGNDVVTRVVRKNVVRPKKANGKTAFELLSFDLSLEGSLSYKRTDFTLGYHYIVPKHTVAPNPTAPFSVLEVKLAQWFGL